MNQALVDALLKAAGQTADPRGGVIKGARANVKKARMIVKGAQDCLSDIHRMHKAAFLAKQAKADLNKAKTPKPGSMNDDDADDNFDHQGAMEKASKAYAQLAELGGFLKNANAELKKAASMREGGPTVGTSDYSVPSGVKDLSPEEVAAGLTNTPMMLDSAAKGAGADSITREHAKALADAAAARAEADLWKSLPSAPINGRRPATFDIGKMNASAGSDQAVLFKNVNVNDLQGEDEGKHSAAVSQVIGNMISGGFGKSITSPEFRGTAGGN